ncbi:MAG: glycerol kinase GlpK [Cyclobacteriaceae bacterium]
MPKYIVTLDAGTTSERAILFNHKAEIFATTQKEFEQIFPQPGWVEHDATTIWKTQLEVLEEVLSKNNVKPEEIAGIGITNQRETTIVWDKATGEPVYNAIVWQDRRTADYCETLKNDHLPELIQNKTGLLIDAYFSASKLKWILDNVDGARQRAEKGELAFGTVDSWLLWNLTDGKVHATDVTNASRTMLFNIHTLEWDDELLKVFHIPKSLLPKVKSSSEIYGYTNISGHDLPVCGIAGDQQSALFGQMCTEPGMLKNTYGTGCFVVLNTGKKIVKSQNNLLSTIAWQINGEVNYALEGSIFIAGALVQFLRDNFKFINNASEIEELAKQVDSSDGVVFVPGFVGLGAPHWDQYSTGTLIGLTRGSSKSHIARAALEAIALQSMEVIETMSKDSGIDIKELRVDGGATANDLLMQIQSNVSDLRIVRPLIKETTAMGAAFLAGIAVGFWKDEQEIKQYWSIEKTFKPEDKDVSLIKHNWTKAIERSKGWNRN